MSPRTVFLAGSILLLNQAGWAQVFVAGLGGAAALSGASVVTAAAAANYDPKVGAALNLAVGYHFNEWVSAQAGYIWNRNRIITTQLAAPVFSQTEAERAQHGLSFDGMIYFRPRADRLRPYLSAGPAVVNVLDQRKLGLRVAVGIDIQLRAAWALRYSFSEVMTANPFAKTLRPAAHGRLMNFQNLFGVVKVF